ncbi:ClbS/DfsB family four-helix bundle protein [Paenibacillus sp. FSL L8-0435]|uniref:ClbS/DfsB family four-helix bundle protein n=1 Tax=Paenibacillus TaxID=44249 RepID=UPI001C8DA23F|nr:ClbS/DfsB family four-helix bundle protein [Paenibacillus xylanexedens]MBY0118095.1 ClbS/DfsB family four-helix bundle protein [Paenibacillus xylanexedens]
MPGILYASKKELSETIRRTYVLFEGEFNDIHNSDKDKWVEGVDKTPAQMIAYQLGWMNLVMDWERKEQLGHECHMPAPGYKWNQLGPLNESFYEKYSGYTLEELRSLFRETEQQWQNWINSLSEEELFVQGMRQWTGTKPGWAMVKWIQINSVAPFKSFRTRIRKWKKGQLANMDVRSGDI